MPLFIVTEVNRVEQFSRWVLFLGTLRQTNASFNTSSPTSPGIWSQGYLDVKEGEVTLGSIAVSN